MYSYCNLSFQMVDPFCFFVFLHTDIILSMSGCFYCYYMAVCFMFSQGTEAATEVIFEYDILDDKLSNVSNIARVSGRHKYCDFRKGKKVVSEIHLSFIT